MLVTDNCDRGFKILPMKHNLDSNYVHTITNFIVLKPK